MTKRVAVGHVRATRAGSAPSQRAADVNALNTLATTALRAESLDDLLRRALPQVCEALVAEHGDLLLWDEDEAEFAVAGQQGQPPDLLRAREAAVLSRERRRTVLLPGEATSSGDAPAVEVIAVPLATRDRFVGAIVVWREQPSERALPDVFLDSLALQLHLALERVSLWQETRMLGEMRRKLLEATIDAQEDERARVARELHDATGQELTSLLLALRTMELTVESEDLRLAIAGMRELATGVLRTIRSLCSELMPRGLEELGLEEALALHVREFEQRYPISLDYEVVRDGLKLPSHEAQLALYRIVQEALTNVARHAQATHVSITLACQGEDIVAVVEDNGVGFGVESAGELSGSRMHLGLFGMKERAELLGGRVTVEATPGGGTTVYASVPVNPSGEA